MRTVQEPARHDFFKSKIFSLAKGLMNQYQNSCSFFFV